MHRRVRRLRLACAHEEHARHGRVLLEDALRTATLHDEGRLIVVRRLDLGRIPLRASATHWSRRIEDTFRQSGATPVRFDAPAARDAAAVYFGHRTEPWFALAARAAQRHPTSEWFWPLAAPGWTSHLQPTETLRCCVRALAAEGGLTLTLQLGVHLHTNGSLEPLLRALHADDLAPVQAQLGPVTPMTDVAVSADALPSQSVAPLTAGVLDCVRQWGPGDVRTHWLATLHLVSGAHCFVLASGDQRALRHQLIAKWTQAILPGGLPPLARPAARQPVSPPANTVAEPSRDEPRSGPASDREATTAGGLFFVLPLLVRAGLPQYLATLPVDDAAALPWQLLQLALVHARTPEDDPLVVALHELPHAPQPLGRWLIAANRHALRLSGLNLRQLISRPALVTLSTTHIDLFFRPGDADIRLRRAALDVDPGWVPWLGRVIAFHFNRED